MIDVAIVGAGPAGMTAALELQKLGLSTTVIDDQPAPGGRIFANIEQRPAHGAEDRSGAALVRRFRQMGGDYRPASEVWQIEPGPRLFLSSSGQAQMIEPRFILMATGAQERPMPFPGWQLPGVMTVGAAQILLKTARQIPDKPVWLAGSGPLLLLYMHQLIAAGGMVEGILDTSPSGRIITAARALPGAITYGWRDLLRGLAWQWQSRSIKVVRGITSLQARGGDKLSHVTYSTDDGQIGEIATELLFIHDGVVPGLHGTIAAGCDHRWNEAEQCFEPILDTFGRTSVETIFAAGDGATIGGARAATLSGRLAAIGIARAAGTMSSEQAETAAKPVRRGLAKAARFRHFVDALYPPVKMALPDETITCRCEEVTARDIRAALKNEAHLGPDGIKIATRAGMGPCQGRQCGASLTRLVREAHGGAPDAIGFLRIRPPLKPLTLGELATLDSGI
ncbi:NAD(P)/FAD-dependent oxidoreductase [Sphingomonas crocodyli]|uniref:FAD-dependent oxidoreductase n=1 Tax=Sphingomonas crocodyli TaxID=1979270 RepID=A0A437M780_9SPHN|nr:NAD(P)/FAD-dependent oxidoreductase [Sphingomonas crocodyli]RVT93509.1 FAD-dependent oxidoreductase [Sphingomonas crocodyli]